MIQLGRVISPFGVKGWIRIGCDPDVTEMLYRSKYLWLGRGGAWKEYEVEEANPHSGGLALCISGVGDRDQAEHFKGCDVALPRNLMPDPQPGEYYWSDLLGMQVINTDGDLLGEIAELLETPVHDVFVVIGDVRRLIPAVAPIVVEISIERQQVVVEWGRDY